MNKVGSGDLKHRILWQRQTTTRDSSGDVTKTYTTMGGAWAKISPLSTSEKMIAAQTRSSITHRITQRYDPAFEDMDGTWRGVYGTRTFIVDGIPRNLDEANQWVEIVATEGLKTE